MRLEDLHGENCVTNISHKAINLQIGNLSDASFVVRNYPFQSTMYLLRSKNSFLFDLTVGAFPAVFLVF
jgi:hypothetical protein